jgi:hypothetical protein
MDGVTGCMTHHGLTDEDSRDKDIWRNLVFGEGNPSTVDKSYDELMSTSNICYWPLTRSLPGI